MLVIQQKTESSLVLTVLMVFYTVYLSTCATWFVLHTYVQSYFLSTKTLRSLREESLSDSSLLHKFPHTHQMLNGYLLSKCKEKLAAKTKEKSYFLHCISLIAKAGQYISSFLKQSPGKLVVYFFQTGHKRMIKLQAQRN